MSYFTQFLANNDLYNLSLMPYSFIVDYVLFDLPFNAIEFIYFPNDL